MTQKIPIKSARVISQIVDDEAVLVIPEKGEIKVINEVGAKIWNLTDGVRTVSEIAAEIAAEYAVTAEQATGDTLTFLDELAKRKLIRWASGTSA